MNAVKFGKHEYRTVDPSTLPYGLRFTAPQHMQGQMVSWSFGSPGQRDEGSPGDLFARRQEGLDVAYFRRSGS